MILVFGMPPVSGIGLRGFLLTGRADRGARSWIARQDLRNRLGPIESRTAFCSSMNRIRGARLEGRCD